MNYIMNDSYLTNVHNLTLSKTKKGLQLKDNKSNVKFILSFDEYSEILKNSRNHPLNKILKKDKLKILDCTGGFCKDSAIMSSLGNNVTMIEKNPLIMRLLKDAKTRIVCEEIQSIFNDINMRLGDCLSFIRDTAFRFDYIYFDFMFNVNKSALPSKKEQFLRKIAENNRQQNQDIINETIKRVNSKIILKEYINSNDYKNFDIINTYKSKTVKYHLINGRK